MIRRSFIILPTLLVAIASSSRADLPGARLTSVFPPGARVGTTVEVTVAGDDLDDVSELRFSHPGVFSRPAVDAAGRSQPNKFVVAVGPSVPPGSYDARAVGRFGVSNPHVFAVGELPETVEGTTNTSPGGATEIAVDSTVSGNCTASAVDH